MTPAPSALSALVHLGRPVTAALARLDARRRAFGGARDGARREGRARHAETFVLFLIFAAAVLVAALSAVTLVAQQEAPRQTAPQTPVDGRFRFKSSVDLINVSATVTDASERFVTGLRKEDFLLFEDDREQPVTHFSDERVPVSLGIVLDSSGSMEGAKFRAAEEAIDRFLRNLLSPDDEVFLMTFAEQPDLIAEWTTDRDKVVRALRRVYPRGGTAMYDAVAEAIPLAQRGRHRKKAIVVISDGNDTTSATDVRTLRSLIRETEVLIYAIGIDSNERPQILTGPTNRPPFPIPIPFPGTGRRFPPTWPGQPPTNYPPPPGGGGGQQRGGSTDRVNAHALRDLTDDSGGRTELIRSASDLGPATAGIADELSRQYSLGYTPAAAKDGRWHTIRVEVRNSNYRVRARRGYIATS